MTTRSTDGKGDCDDDGDDFTATTKSSVRVRVRALVRLARENISDDVRLSRIVKLDLSGQGLGLSSLPDGMNGMADLLPNLSVLFLSNNNFTEMPEFIGRCQNLQMVAFKSNGMLSIHPEALQPQLRWLILTDNKLTQIPETIGRCSLLQKCMLSGNLLTSLPLSMNHSASANGGNHEKLELIRLASNRLTEPPLELLKLPQLRWVALGDNPFLKGVVETRSPATATTGINIIKGIDEMSGTVLGKGAGGTTVAVDYQGRTVAVKVYGGATMTSDGLPETERKIALAASQLDSGHGRPPAALIQVLGECESTGSLVMEYLDDYTALAGPPSLDSCSRDVYSSNKNNNSERNSDTATAINTDASPCETSQTVTALSWEEAANMISVLVDALVQLHRAGITHGDFYGHNILVQRSNLKQVRLSDFGAAYFYDKEHETAYGALLETIELRAFAVLVEEVSTVLLNEKDDQKSRLLTELVLQCHDPGATFDSVQIWWQQKLLAVMATAFGVFDD